MPLLGTLLVSGFSSLVAWLGQWLTRKAAFGVAAVATMTGFTGALYVTFRAVLAGLNSQAMNLPEFWTMVLQISVPPAAPFCISSYFTIWTACTVYTWQRDLLHLVVKA